MLTWWWREQQAKYETSYSAKSWELQSAKENPGSCWIHNQRFSPTHQLLLALRAPTNGDVRKPGRTLEAGVLVSPINHHPAVRINHLCNQNPSSQWGSLGCNFEKDMSMGTNTGTNPWQEVFVFWSPEISPWEVEHLWRWQTRRCCWPGQSPLRHLPKHFLQTHILPGAPALFSPLRVYSPLPTQIQILIQIQMQIQIQVQIQIQIQIQNVRTSTNTCCLSWCFLSFSCFHHFLSRSHFSSAWLGMITNSEKGTENQDKWDLDVCVSTISTSPHLDLAWWQILKWNTK